ncbi:hypothetical protein [Cronobacter sakazakii]|nr:hypothetical protein [Cronobacter sakazakii]EJG0809360.1 hypothetical protein [Cronobacter sakazakii]ELY4686573.1 hypothetical protein [Cronobacter sakazakii]ELY5782319.1 hypothetical protein [Cronobacter sakazakii]HDK7278081.1 hypothetical protein [Cronobacter sakazakii]HDK7334352.1 hypothetical protein [Cronobacter sakazakii]
MRKSINPNVQQVPNGGQVMPVIKRQREVYFAPTRGRCYLTLRGAINAEARAIIFSRYPSTGSVFSDGMLIEDPWSITTDDPERYQKMYRRLKRLIAKSVISNSPTEHHKD